METRLAKDKGKQVWVKCGFSDGWEVSRVGFGGGLILAWNQTFCFLWRLGLLKTKENKFGSSVVRVGFGGGLILAWMPRQSLIVEFA